jgi:hypothetical protein
MASVGEIDADQVARWIVEHYPPRRYPAVVVGSPHGAAVHLAAAAGVPWLPGGFEMVVRWPEGSVDDPAAALVHGAAVAARLRANNPDLTIRQVHDPVSRRMLAGCTITLHVRWRRLPDPYRELLSASLRPGGAVVVVRDMRTWPVLDTAHGHTFQLGTPGAGLEPDEYLLVGPQLRQVLRCTDGDASRWRPPTLAAPDGHVETGLDESVRAWAGARGAPLHRLLYARPEALSGAVADVYRQWLHRPDGDRLIVERGRLFDPASSCAQATSRTGAKAPPAWWRPGWSGGWPAAHPSTPSTSLSNHPVSPPPRLPPIGNGRPSPTPVSHQAVSTPRRP